MINSVEHREIRCVSSVTVVPDGGTRRELLASFVQASSMGFGNLWKERFDKLNANG
jgi:hypothetical protein